MKAAAVAALLTWSLYGQCVMCNRTAAAQQAERARVLNAGILVLLAPSLIILGGFVWLAKRGGR